MRWSWLVLLAALGCDDGGEDAAPDSGAGGAGGMGGAGGVGGAGGMGGMGGGGPDSDGCYHRVAPADGQEALQTVLIEAQPGEVVCLEAGTFVLTTEISVSVDDLTVRGAGMEATILDFSGQTVGSNGVLISGDGVIVEDFQIKDSPGDGIRAQAVDGVVFRRIRALWSTPESGDNGAYGLYPVGSTNVLVEGCIVSGASDAGIYVGQSTRILVKDSEAFGNVAGIEIENSSDAEVVGNHAHDNTGGILVFNLPELPMKNGERTLVHQNTIENNNIANFGKAGSVVSLVPGGSGAFLLAADHNEFRNNIIRGNSSAGLLLISYLPDLMGAYEDAEFDRFAQENAIHDNEFSNNGTGPQGILRDLGLMQGADILTDGCQAMGTPTGGNCIREAEGLVFANLLTDLVPALGLDYCAEPLADPEDLTPYDCELDPLPGQSF